MTGNNAGYNGDYIPVFGEKTGILKGFYKVSAYTRQPNCDRAVYKFKDPAKPKPACDEHFLPKTWWGICNPYNDIQLYGHCEITKSTLTDFGGVIDATAEAFDFKEARIVPAKCKTGEIIGYHVFYSSLRLDKPVLQVGKDKLDEFKNNYDIYTLGGGMYYANGEPSVGTKNAAAGVLTGNWSLYWEGLKQEWTDCLTTPECAATVALSSVNGALSQFQTKIPATVFRISWAENQKWLTTTKTTRIGRWMDKIEYDKMVNSQTLQESKNGITHVLLEGPTGFEASAPKGSLYVEFDIPTGVSIIRGSGDGWGLFFSPNNSPHYGFYTSKGLNVVQPSVSNTKSE